MVDWAALVLILILWIAAGRVIFSGYKSYVEKKYPPSEFNAGFFVHLIGRCTQAEMPHEYVAYWYLNVTMALKYRMLIRVFDYVLWPASLTPLIIYKEFAETKKSAEQ